jgi:hypothetical protein
MEWGIAGERLPHFPPSPPVGPLKYVIILAVETLPPARIKVKIEAA